MRLCVRWDRTGSWICVLLKAKDDILSAAWPSSTAALISKKPAAAV